MDLRYMLLNPIYNAYKQSVPANVRMLVKSMTNPTPVTQNNFTPKELDVIKKTVQNAQNRGGNYVGYKDYPTQPGNGLNYNNVPQMIMNSVQDPAYALQNTLGRAKIVPQNDGSTLISDRYDFEPTTNFDPSEVSRWSPTFQALHNLGASMNTQMPVDIILKQQQY